MVLEEPRQAEDDRGGGHDEDVGVGALDGAETLGVQRPADGDVAVDRQQHGQPGVDHAQHVGAREQPAVQTDVHVLVVDVDERRHVAERPQQEDDQQNQRVGHRQRLPSHQAHSALHPSTVATNQPSFVTQSQVVGCVAQR